MSPYRTNNICDHCGRTATLEGICENPNKPYPTGWYCSDCLTRLYTGKMWDSKNSIVIDGSQFQPEAGNVSITPSVWPSNDKPYLTGQCGADGSSKPNNILEQTIKERSTRLAFQKEILEYLKVTADMAENNDELAWRIWQVYGRLEDLWEK